MADSEYTPTTAYVRNDYSRDGDGSSDEMAAAEFDRWLAARDARVRAEERERCAVKVEESIDNLRKLAVTSPPDAASRKDLTSVENLLSALAAAIRALPSTPETGETK